MIYGPNKCETSRQCSVWAQLAISICFSHLKSINPKYQLVETDWSAWSQFISHHKVQLFTSVRVGGWAERNSKQNFLMCFQNCIPYLFFYCINSAIYCSFEGARMTLVFSKYLRKGMILLFFRICFKHSTFSCSNLFLCWYFMSDGASNIDMEFNYTLSKSVATQPKYPCF